MALIEAFQSVFVSIMRLPINLFIRQLYLAFKQNSAYLKQSYKKEVVSLNRNALVSLNPERVVTLNRNQVVSLSEISNDLMHFLSFLNGAPIALKREFMGRFQTSSEKDVIGGEISYTYSYKSLSNQIFSEYVPINTNHGWTAGIFPILALKGFECYGKHNRLFDLNALVDSLNNAYQTSGAKERYYILITALEKIASNFNNSQDKSETLFNGSYFNDTLKSEILEVLNKHKSAIKKDNKAAFDILKSRIGTLNRITNNDTKVKLFRFFDFCKIDASPYIKNLIETERNQAVHEGKVGNTYQEAFTAYLKLDHLLRDVVLNLMEYPGIRNPRVKYQSPFPYNTPWSRVAPKDLSPSD